MGPFQDTLTTLWLIHTRTDRGNILSIQRFALGTTLAGAAILGFGTSPAFARIALEPAAGPSASVPLEPAPPGASARPGQPVAVLPSSSSAQWGNTLYSLSGGFGCGPFPTGGICAD